MPVPDDRKTDVLLACLAACQVALDKIRDRVESVCLWIIGIQFTAGGWLLQSTADLSCTEKGLLVIGVCLAVWVIRYHYFEDLLRGFRNQQQTAVRIEEALHLFDKGAYGGPEAMFFEEWRSAGKPDSKGNYFKNSFKLLWMGTLFLVAAILTA